MFSSSPFSPNIDKYVSFTAFFALWNHPLFLWQFPTISLMQSSNPSFDSRGTTSSSFTKLNT